ncbi:helix-turn-helix domain-containing protein [candidate division WOR-3 bacterium]|nr:helix-turn-helix domain-containing protein [candidate division WOR-3 bacterium]
MVDRFSWVPAEARLRYEIFEAAYGERPYRTRPVSIKKKRRVCEKYRIAQYQLSRIIERQLQWDKFLTQLGRDPVLRKEPETTKDAICRELRRTSTFNHIAEDNLRHWMNRVVRYDQPCKLGYGDRSLPRRLRMLGQLRRQPVPKNRFRKVTPELAARIKALAGQDPRPSLRRIEQLLRHEGYDISYGTVRRTLSR